MTDLLNKDAFKWSEKAELAFEKLKEACSQPPCLALLDFCKTFIVECDASGYRIGVVLMQEGRPLAFYSQALKGKTLFLSTYEKELMVLVLAVKTWRPYLFGNTFVIKTDQQKLEASIGEKDWHSNATKVDFKAIGIPLCGKVQKGEGKQGGKCIAKEGRNTLICKLK